MLKTACQYVQFPLFQPAPCKVRSTVIATVFMQGLLLKINLFQLKPQSNWRIGET